MDTESTRTIFARSSHELRTIFARGPAAQLINAVLHALSADNVPSSPASVVAASPYYGMYRAQTVVLHSRDCQWKGATNMLTNLNASNSMKSVELVTSPNNPDGRLRKPVLGGSAVIYDHAYYWPHYTAIPAPADEDIMLFSFSKLSGHGGSRFGWVLVKDDKVYQKVLQYIFFNSMGVSRDTQLRVLKLINVALSELRGKEDIFKFGYETAKERWKKLSNIISSSSRFSIQQLSPENCTYFQKIREPSPAYAWLKCEREEDRDCEVVL